MGDKDYTQEYRDNSQHFLPKSGDGIVTEQLCRLDSRIRVVVADGSKDMLAAAMNRLSKYSIESFVLVRFEDLIDEAVDLGRFDFVISSFALHHLESPQRRTVFSKVWNMLLPDSYFVNVVLPATEIYEDWYYNLWREWIHSHENRVKLNASFGHVPDEARVRPENFYDILESQLEDMCNVGFMEVACHYRYGLFGIYSGRRQ